METWLIGLLIVGATALLFVRIDRIRGMSIGGGPAEEPCWTEQDRRADGLSYGRSCCYNDQLADTDARAEAGEFNTYSGG
jgi:hypothetical protein